MLIMHSTIVAHSPPNNCGNANNFQEAINHWMRNDKSKTCTRVDTRHNNQPSHVQVYGSMMQGSKWEPTDYTH